MADRFEIILAAGKGTRMKSPRPKVLHEIGGRSMLAWSVALAKDLGCKRTVVVVGPDMPLLSEAAAKFVGAENVVIQRDQLGTANAQIYGSLAGSAMAGMNTLSAETAAA
jgi:bifunctional UDP-N-acetylglucosamine pyrophosphorylase/glucosamine-1-phosphate N-acetyltransferase